MKTRSLTILIALAALTLLSGMCSAAESTAARPMNVLFLIVDDLNTWLLADTNRYTGDTE